MLRPEYPIETERLLLRPYREADVDVLHDIQSRPEVVRCTGSRARVSRWNG